LFSGRVGNCDWNRRVRNNGHLGSFSCKCK
jgi:hypothetical protein